VIFCLKIAVNKKVEMKKENERGVGVINGKSVGMCFVPVRVRKRCGAFVISKARNRGRGAWVILGCPRIGAIREFGRNQ